ncbi:MAG: enoyl-CoA hydratase/isomerase family protein [Planctomycetes bacterium]|nr:enoyl-CoA hydratase/isomerase family protein [Planctomycetota bacterium]
MIEVLREGIVRVESWDSGAFWRIVLDRPPENRLDDTMVEALTEVFERARAARDLRATVLVAAGDDFSLGADPREQLPERFRTSLRAWLRLIRTMLDVSVFRIAVVRGRCMGRGLELARICNRVYAAPDARLGLPEIEMGLLPPVASIVLPERIGRGAAAELCATGYVKVATEASWMQLVDHAVADPEPFAIQEVRHFLLRLSASSLRLALRAVDLGFRSRVLAGLDAVEKLCLDELAHTHDAGEGVRAAIEGRAPCWRNE